MFTEFEFKIQNAKSRKELAFIEVEIRNNFNTTNDLSGREQAELLFYLNSRRILYSPITPFRK